MKPFSIVILLTFCYILFSFDIIIDPFYAKIFANDFSKEGVADWLYYQLKVNFFILIISVVGCIDKYKEFTQCVLLAVVIDAILNIFESLIFGYYAPVYISAIINAIPLAYIYYSYFCYGRLD